MKKQIILFLASLLVVAVLSMVGSVAPESGRKLLLLYALFGAVSGMAIRWLCTEIAVVPNRWTYILTMLLIATGAANIGRLGYFEFWNVRQTSMNNNPKQQAALRMLEEMSKDNPEHMAAYAEHRREFEPQFVDYLKHRLSGFGEAPPWLAIGFWIFEILVSALTGGYILWFASKQIPVEQSTT